MQRHEYLLRHGSYTTVLKAQRHTRTQSAQEVVQASTLSGFSWFRFCTFCVSHCYGFSGTSRSSGVLLLIGCVPVQAPAEVMQLLSFVRELTSLKVEGFDPLVVFLCSTIEQLHNLRRLEVMSKVTPAEATQVLLRLCYTTHVQTYASLVGSRFFLVSSVLHHCLLASEHVGQQCPCSTVGSTILAEYCFQALATGSVCGRSLDR